MIRGKNNNISPIIAIHSKRSLFFLTLLGFLIIIASLKFYLEIIQLTCRFNLSTIHHKIISFVYVVIKKLFGNLARLLNKVP